MAGPLFMEMAEDISVFTPGSIVYTGHESAFARKNIDSLIIIKAPVYNRKTMTLRIGSWIVYFCKAMVLAFKMKNRPLLFIVSNPPFLGFIGYFLNVLRRQQYVILAYDLYPDILTAFGKTEKNLFVYLWSKYNEVIYSRASMVFTIGDDMAKRLSIKTKNCPIEVIRCWADTQVIKPLCKYENSFAREHNLVDKTVLLYSGNMGYTHNIELLIESVNMFKDKNVHFLFIGEGAKRKRVEELLKTHSDRITLLPFQPETMLPYTLSAGDIGFVSYQRGTEGCMVPSKAYYYLAAGVCLFVLGKTPNELATTVEKYQCGRVIDSNNVEDLVGNVNEVIADRALLQLYKSNARLVSEKYFSRKNTQQFLTCIRNLSSGK